MRAGIGVFIVAALLCGCAAGGAQPASTTSTTSTSTTTTTTLPPTTVDPCAADEYAPGCPLYEATTVAPVPPSTVSYAEQLQQCEASEYDSDYAAAVPVFEQSLGRAPTQAEVENIASQRCQQILANEGITP